MSLSSASRYQDLVSSLTQIPGIGLLTALVYLTELGDLSRFANQQKMGSYLGLTPCSFESGQANDRKGHITRQGPARIRKVLCQAVWAQVRWDPVEREAYQRICQRNPKTRKKAIVACMRRLGVRLWHRGMEVLARREAVREAAAV